MPRQAKLLEPLKGQSTPKRFSMITAYCIWSLAPLKFIVKVKACMNAKNRVQLTFVLSRPTRHQTANSYGKKAQSAANNNNYTTAYAFVAKGLEIDSTNALLSSIKNEYQSESNIIELGELFKTAVSFPNDVRLKISQIETANPARYGEFSKTSAATLADRINALQSTDENAAASLAQSAAVLFPANAVLAVTAPNAKS